MNRNTCVTTDLSTVHDNLPTDLFMPLRRESLTATIFFFFYLWVSRFPQSFCWPWNCHCCLQFQSICFSLFMFNLLHWNNVTPHPPLSHTFPRAFLWELNNIMDIKVQSPYNWFYVRIPAVWIWSYNTGTELSWKLLHGRESQHRNHSNKRK